MTPAEMETAALAIALKYGGWAAEDEMRELFARRAEVAEEAKQRPYPSNFYAALGGIPHSGLSWNGFNLFGDHKSIREVERLQCEAARADALLSMLKSAESRAEAAEARVREADKVCRSFVDALSTTGISNGAIRKAHANALSWLEKDRAHD